MSSSSLRRSSAGFASAGRRSRSACEKTRDDAEGAASPVSESRRLSQAVAAFVTGPFCAAPLWEDWNAPTASHTSLIQSAHASRPLRSSAAAREPRRVEGHASGALTGVLLNKCSSEGRFIPPDHGRCSRQPPRTFSSNNSDVAHISSSSVSSLSPPPPVVFPLGCWAALLGFLDESAFLKDPHPALLPSGLLFFGGLG